MSRFKDRLWRDLVREHGGELAQIPRPVAKHSRRARPRVLAGTTAGLVGIGTALALILSAAGSSPAFAVTRNHDGTVTIALRAFSAIHDANQKLAGAGLPAKLVQVRIGCPAPNARLPLALTAAWRARATAQRVLPARAHIQARFDPRKIPAGQTLVIAAWRTGRSIHVTAARAVRGGAPACLPPPAPPPGFCRITKVPPPGPKIPPPATSSSPGSGTGTTGSGTGTTRVAPPPIPQAQIAAPANRTIHWRPFTGPRPLRAKACMAAMLHAAPPTPGNSHNSGHSGGG